MKNPYTSSTIGTCETESTHVYLVYYVLDFSSRRPAWRDHFLVERGKMTPHRYEKLLHLHPANANAIPRFGEDGELLAPVAATTVASDSNATAATPPPAESGLDLLGKPRLTEQERLAVECLKPRYRAPCAPLQVNYAVLKLIITAQC